MHHTEATKQKLSAMRKGAANPFFGKKHTPETRAKLASHLRSCSTNRTYDISPLSLMIPRDNDLAYLAGIIDGEGSIRFRRGRPFVAIYNSDANLKQWVKDKTGIDPTWQDFRGRVPGWQWCISAAADVYLLCDRLTPFLVVKKADAMAAMDHLDSKYGSRLLEVING